MPPKGRVHNAGFCRRQYSCCLFASVRSNTLGAAIDRQWKLMDELDQIAGNQAIQRQGEGTGRKLAALVRAAHRAPNQDYRKIDYIDIAILVP